MRSERLLFALLSLTASACGPKAEERRQNPEQPADVAGSAPALPNPVGNEDLATEPAPLGEPKGSIDPTSADAAGEVVELYGTLIEQGRWADARKLWSNASAAAEFEHKLRADGTSHVEIGNPRDEEGAAGSIYVMIPAIFYNDTESGQPSRLEAEVLLRRVNDVPGSTEAQRHWHIERIESAR
jgi:hypothetical protein